jgi:hypothetical protein
MVVAISPRVESSVRELSVRIYLDYKEANGEIRKSDDYDAACSIFIYGYRGLIYNVHGKGFYLAVEALVKDARVYGIKTLEGYVLKPHARLIKKETNKLGLGYAEGPTTKTFEREMTWITVSI